MRALALLVAALLAAQAWAVTAAADDEELARKLPGLWYSVEEVGEDDESLREVKLTLLLVPDGTLTLLTEDPVGAPAATLTGTWAFTLVRDGLDTLTLTFDPAEEGGVPVECVYQVYAEGWVENDIQNTWLIMEDGVATGGVSPFTEILGYDGAVGVHREEGPNMRVVNCKEYVSMRAERSTKSDRLMKVPLGALVFAFPEFGDENGFLLCSYHDESGFILAEYLEPVE